MNLHTPALLPRTVDDFLRWNDGREGKREFVDGRVVEMMVGVSRNHSRVAANLVMAFGRQLDRDRFEFGTADFGVLTMRGVRYPDVFVEPVGGSGVALASEAPLLVAEILSPSSIALDFGPKAEEYRAIASLLPYVVLAQDDRRAWVWTRSDRGFPVEPDMVTGGEGGLLALPLLGVTLSLAELYRGVA